MSNRSSRPQRERKKEAVTALEKKEAHGDCRSTGEDRGKSQSLQLDQKSNFAKKKTGQVSAGGTDNTASRENSIRERGH